MDGDDGQVLCKGLPRVGLAGSCNFSHFLPFIYSAMLSSGCDLIEGQGEEESSSTVARKRSGKKK